MVNRIFHQKYEFMKLKTFLLSVFFTLFLFGCCQSVFAQTGESQLAHSMKGYELYSWQVGRQWYFSLLIGTNRQKNYKEVTSPKVRIKGTEALKRKLDLLPTGEELSWSKHRIRKISMPPQAVINEIIAFCKKRRLALRISQ